MNMKALIAKLNGTTRGVLQHAVDLCKARSHSDTEIEHFLAKLAETTDTDFFFIARHFGIDSSRLSKEITARLDSLRSGSSSAPMLGVRLMEMFEKAWLIGSIDYSGDSIRSGYIALALVSDRDLSRYVSEWSREFQRIGADALRKDFVGLIGYSRENAERSSAAASSGHSAGSGPVPAAGGKTPNLDQYTINLTENARQGRIDPVLGRDFEIRQAIDILMRRRQNNPILTGEAGVGKTAVVEGLALRIGSGDVPPPLRNVILRTLDLALLQAGAGVRGEFENRLKGLIEEVKASPTPIILFIDEAHTMIGAGGQAGQGDAANLLKPALARGELRTVAATTWSEYKKYFEKDAALARRFQVVKVEEPAEHQCMVMLRGITPMLEKHHNVRILDEAVRSAVRLSDRYISGRQLPDKAVSVLDTACARLSLGQNATPAALENATRRLEDMEIQQRVLEREAATGADHSARLAEIADTRSTLEAEVEALKQRWETEKRLVGEIRRLRGRLEESAVMAASAGAGTQAAVDETALRSDLERLSTELAQCQGETPLMGVCVDAQVIGEVISAWTGIPVGKMLKDDIGTVLNLRDSITRRLVGQDHALEAISRRIQSSRAGLDDPNKPVGVFMLIGPSGVGKTETALALSDLMYGGERNLITINMSEFQEAHTVSTLKGSPPGYVGYGEGGVLTEAVRRRPYSVVLLDEVEKAHPDVLELFYQVFDKGSMEDGEGREINFRNTIIILTTNACTDQMMKLCADPETMPSPDGLVRAIKPDLNKIFKPAFLGRMILVPYLPLGDEVMRTIIVLKLGRIANRMQETHGITFTWDDSIVDEVAKRCTEVESGARNVDNILTNTMLPDISRQLLGRLAEGEKIQAIRVGLTPEGTFVYN
jgi:type VI secretion system protein VasG